jgi:hypothetical protein
MVLLVNETNINSFILALENMKYLYLNLTKYLQGLCEQI